MLPYPCLQFPLAWARSSEWTETGTSHSGLRTLKHGVLMQQRTVHNSAGHGRVQALVRARGSRESELAGECVKTGACGGESVSPTHSPLVQGGQVSRDEWERIGAWVVVIRLHVRAGSGSWKKLRAAASPRENPMAALQGGLKRMSRRPEALDCFDACLDIQGPRHGCGGGPRRTAGLAPTPTTSVFQGGRVRVEYLYIECSAMGRRRRRNGDRAPAWNGHGRGTR